MVRFLAIIILIYVLELNMERRRKRKASKKLNGMDDMADMEITDPLIELLIDKENRWIHINIAYSLSFRYQALVNSAVMPIHQSLKESLTCPQAFDEAFTKVNEVFTVLSLFSTCKIQWLRERQLTFLIGEQRFYQYWSNGLKVLRWVFSINPFCFIYSGLCKTSSGRSRTTRSAYHFFKFSSGRSIQYSI